MADNKPTCTVDECCRPHRSRGLCNMHYQRLIAHGTTDPRPRPTNEDRFWAKVEKSDGCWNWASQKGKTGYAMFSIGRDWGYAHRFSYELANGPIPEGMFVDHVCHNKGCVNPEHLRLATNAQNLQNRKSRSTNNEAGHLGVYRAKGRWTASVTLNGVKHRKYGFLTPEEAAEAARLMRLELFTHNDHDRTDNQEEAA